jgi:anti-anti-sigma regulatory factor
VLVPLHSPPAQPTAALLPVNLAEVDAAHLVRILPHPPTPLLVDCGSLPCQRTLGICFLVSQLLVLRQSGATVYLRNASPVLLRCLQKLQLSSIFPLAAY